MMPKYDFIFSLGAACSCTQMLRKAQLQFASYPLDWLFGSDLAGRIDIVASRFERFLVSYVYSERSISCDAYHNEFNDLTFNHDFESGKELKETYLAVKEKYDRRIKRLLDRIEAAQTVLGVFVETPDSGKSKYTAQDLREIHAKLNNAFPNKRFDLLYISPDTEMGHGETVTELSEDGLDWIITEYSYTKHNEPPYSVDHRVMLKILKKYKLNLPLSFRLKRLLQRLYIRAIPIKSVRKKTETKIQILKGTRMNFRPCPGP